MEKDPSNSLDSPLFLGDHPLSQELNKCPVTYEGILQFDSDYMKQTLIHVFGEKLYKQMMGN